MIKKDKIYLIDFGNSYFINEASHRRLLLGTVGYAAPEQYTYGSLDERTDIYGIGAVLYYMVTGLRCDHTSLKSLEIPNNIRERYKKIILQCLSKDMDERFKSVSAIQDNLENIVKKDSACESGEKPLTIAISGTKTRVGVTHVSLGLAAYMSALGYDVMYQEVNESNHMRNMAKQLGLPLEGGWFVKDGLKIMPEYGESVRLSVHERYIIKDFGVAREDIYGTLAACDIICLIDSADYWDLSQSVKMVQSLRMYLGLVTHPVKFYLLCNTSGKCATELYRQTGYVGMEIPCIRDIFERDRAVEQFYRELIVAFGIEKRAGENHKKKRRLFCKT